MRISRLFAAGVAALLVVGFGIVGAVPVSANTCPYVEPNRPYSVTPAPSPGVDWSGCSLASAFLPLADLSGADLSGAYLAGVDLAGANLAGANLAGAQLIGIADLGGANLSGANLTGADLTDAYLRYANLSGANLTGANLVGSDLGGANLTGAAVDCGTGGVLGTYVFDEPTVHLPSGWTLVAGTLTAPTVPCDDDRDGVADDADLCPGTVLPDDGTAVKKNRYVADGDGLFGDSGYTIVDTGGCSAAQIIDAAGLGEGYAKFGVSGSALEAWISSLR